jgi:4-hydroxy-tetrahydrodipicolinate reductase
MIRVALIGASGRMGCAIAAAALESPWKDALRITAPIVSASSRQELEAGIATADVVVDFSTAESVLRTGDACVAAGKPLLVGVTGLPASFKAAASAWSSRIALLVAPNTSLGVAVLSRLVEEAARALGPAVDVRITEAHHAGKKDAPSGTAKALGEAIAAGRGVPLQDSDFASIRAGDIVGEHSVLFAAPGEQIVLGHRATDRAVFARGALRAALWLAGRKPGLFRMTDVLQKSDFGVDTRGVRP